MNPRAASLAILVGFGTLAQSQRAVACGCLGTVPSSVAAQHAEVVFVGTVARVDRPEPISQSRRNPDGSTTVTVESGSGFPELVVFDVAHVFKGPSPPQIAVVRGNTSCDLPFRPGETWLIFGQAAIGGVRTDSCSRSRLASEDAQDLLYLSGLEAGRPQGVVYGDVFRRIDDPTGSVLRALFEPLAVVAANGIQKLRTTTDRWGPFELVLPPGDYDIWVQKGDTAVSGKRTVRVEDGADVKLQLVVEYSDR